MHRLTPCDNQLSFADAAVANVSCAVWYILKKPTREKSTVMRQFCRKRVYGFPVILFRNIPRNWILIRQLQNLSFFYFFPVKVFRFTEKNEFAVIEIYDAYKNRREYFRFKVRVS